jgi:hypothetical protein
MQQAAPNGVATAVGDKNKVAEVARVAGFD